MLCASLKPLGVPAEKLLAAAGRPTARIEDLSISEFCALAGALEALC